MARGGRALEDHVLEQVGHAGLAVALVPGADQNGHVDRDGRPRRLREKQDAGAVGEPVFGHAFDRGDLLRLVRPHGRHEKEYEEERGQSVHNNLRLGNLVLISHNAYLAA